MKQTYFSPELNMLINFNGTSCLQVIPKIPLSSQALAAIRKSLAAVWESEHAV